MNRESDRILRASIPEPYCNATSSVGGAQGYIADLERQRDKLREALEEITDAVSEAQGRANKLHHMAGLERHMHKVAKARAALEEIDNG